MMKTSEKIFIILLFAILLISIISANFQIGDPSHSIETQYGKGEYIRGWINISLDNEPTNSVFRTSGGDEIALIELLDLNEVVYSCSPSDCGSDYYANDAKTTKSFSLNKSDSVIFGFKFDEDIIQINSVNFSLNSNAPASCFNQLKIDFSNDGSIDSGNDKVLAGSGSCEALKSKGCFSEQASTNEYSIGYSPNKHCQRIRLSESPGFNLGAWVRKNSDTRNLVMALYDLDGYEIPDAKCNLGITAHAEGEISCDVNYLVTEPQEHYICIYSDESIGTSKIRGYSPQNGCGFYGSGVQDEIASFDIFARGKAFDSITSLEINDDLPGGNKVSQLIENYIYEKYNSLDCSGRECVVPIKFISGIDNQEITISSLKIDYETTLGPTSQDNFYNISETPAKLNIDEFMILNLDEAGFSVPSSYDSHTFKLYLKGREIFTEEIIVEKRPVIEFVFPIKTAAALPIKFRVKVDISDSGANITAYEWDFGDGTNEVTIKNEVIHTYDSLGEYEISVSVTDENQLTSSKTFDITIESPKEAMDDILQEKLNNLKDVELDINDFPIFYRTTLYEILDLTDSKNTLNEIEDFYNSMVPESPDKDYIDLMKSLVEIEIPESVGITKSADRLTFYPSENSIDLEILQSIGGGRYDSTQHEDYINDILFWQQENLDADLSFEELSVNYGGFKEPILSIFELKIKKKKFEEDPYLIIDKLKEIKFKENLQWEEKSGYLYMLLEEKEETITFSTTENVDFFDLPVFISPKINSLSIIENGSLGEEEARKDTITLLIIILIILIGISAYVIYQTLKKKKYKKYGIMKGPEKRKGIFEQITEKLLGGMKKKRTDHTYRKRYPMPPRRLPRERFYRYH